MRRKITVVVGNNFGDEGKGLATDYFSEQSIGIRCYRGLRFN
jgi:adenylosuccinate synthase